jgi:YegS/Rv2252/BmrU family lipid kinase
MQLQKIKVKFIINPKSGVYDKSHIVGIIEQYIDSNKYDFEVLWTKYSGHGFRLAKEAISDGTKIVCAVGGDGSVHNVASGLVGSDVVLGIVPTGSGNGLARHLEIPTDVKAAVITLNQMKIRDIDVGKVNNKYFFNVAGFGFDGKIAKLFAKSTKRGMMKYAQLVLREFMRSKPHDFSIQLDNGIVISDSALMISMANASEFGNGFSISPLSNVHDGIMELVVTSKPSIFSFPGILKKAIDRQVHTSQFVKTYRFKKMNVIEANDSFHADGEPVAVKLPATIEVVPKALRVIAGENYI